MSLTRNTLINFTGAVAPTLISLVFVPLYLGLIGDVRYGVLALVWLFLDYFGFFDLGIGKATANQMARLRDAPTVEREAMFWTGALINGGLGLLGGIVLLGAGHYLLSGYFGDKLTPEMQNEVRMALPWMAAAVPIATLSAANVAALEASERFLVLNILGVLATLLFQTLPLVTAYWRGPAVDELIASSIGGRLIASIPLFLACWHYVPLRGRPRLRRSLVRPLVRYGGWVTVTAVIGPMLVSLDRVLIGSQIGPSAVAHYTVPYNLVTKLWVVPSSLSRVLFPRFSLLDWEECARLARQAVLSLAAITLPLVLVATILMRPFLSLWVGSEFAKASASVGEILLIGVWINNLAWIPMTMLQGQGRPEVVAKFHAIELLPFVIALWIGIGIAGLQGAAWAWVVRVTVDAVLMFSAVGLKGRIYSVICSGLGLIVTMWLVVNLADDLPAIRVSVTITFLMLGLYYGVRVAPSDLWMTLVRALPFVPSYLTATKR
jgi:O-antigen/teichoic acid export membrane protein